MMLVSQNNRSLRLHVSPQPAFGQDQSKPPAETPVEKSPLLRTSMLGLAILGMAGCQYFPEGNGATEPTQAVVNQTDQTDAFEKIVNDAPLYTTSFTGKAEKINGKWVLNIQRSNTAQSLAGKSLELDGGDQNPALYQRLEELNQKANGSLSLIVYGNPGKGTIRIWDAAAHVKPLNKD